MSGSSMVTNWNYPTAMRVGPGRISELPHLCREMGMATPMLVTDPGLAALPMLQGIVENCLVAGLPLTVFSGIKGNPTGTNVSDGVATFKAHGCDGVIALGGGSALDAGKAIALMVGQTQPIWAFEDVGDNYLKVNTQGMVPVIAVPTTAGTGSEVGRSSVITDEQARLKKIIFHPRMLPAIVLLDPELTLGLPAPITAATGMDALSHNLEAFCANNFHPMAEGIALEAMRLIHVYLPRAVADGNDLEARMQMLVASSMGATAFQRGLGAMHALAHPLGALFDKHHGLLNAILMPYVLAANRVAIEEPMSRLSRYLALPSAGYQGVLDWVLFLRRDLGIPHSLGEIGIDVAQSGRVGTMAAQDPSALGNPVAFDAGSYQRLFETACVGDLDGAGHISPI
ncbi:iron-containing alcohol dehydrogenase [Microbulbifer salipaludis]|uniref:Iron-containing alcohol dehydrogenase n=1 Tax=Microbulbifer salipaludis TaxID=187980 RepID=A0ABS3E5Z5_9GAMM|nr:iron-containing alcohol dehydrogenase [Microbulbifer salipaludis]MBN8430732.1 iron-containing alcohol dehydrogenase [Microbulbifer salipaludis]